jgi:hypothetical protein
LSAAAGEGEDLLARRWRWMVLLFWIGAAVWLLWARWGQIHWFALGDTDDNMRMMQVRGLLTGQDWFDLRQHRLDPPYGADIHWSRLVDLPIAGIKLLLAPLLGGALAEKAAVAIAPLLPLAVVMTALAVIARRLVSPRAYLLALALLLCAHSTRGMFVPLRIDHHGWQLAMLSLAALGLTDPRRARGGLILGLASALSLSIGLEMLLYLAVAGAVTGLMWIFDRSESDRLAAYGASLAGGCAAGYLLFASNANRAPVCDALSPVWLSAMAAAGAVCVLLAFASPRTPLLRLVAGAAGGAVVAAGFALLWPHCLGRLEGVSPELQRLWLDNVREARPIYVHSWATIFGVLPLPIAGLAGYGLMIWQRRGDPKALAPWAALGALALLAASLLLWQTRAGPAAQLLSIVGATGLGWWLLMRLVGLPQGPLRALALAAAFILVSGLGVQNLAKFIPEKSGRKLQAVNRANSRCPTLPALRPIALQPRGYVLTFVDLGPRLITVTHHDAVAGPYHRNQQAIVDVMRSFRGTPEYAHQIVRRRGVDYVLICPGMSESTLYASAAPNGFYRQLARGQVPAWLRPVSLPKGSPYRMWRVRR